MQRKNLYSGIARTVGLVAALSPSYIQAGNPTTNPASTTQPTTQPAYVRNENLTGTQLDKTSNGQFDFSVETVPIHGKFYVIQDNPLRKEDELDFVLREVYNPSGDNARLSLNFGTNKLEDLVSDYVLVPTKVLKKDGTLATEAVFQTNGPYAIKANVKAYDPSAGVSNLTQKDVEFSINEVSINGEEWFYPKAKDNNPVQAPFYLVRKSTSSGHINLGTGAITLATSEGIYSPLRFSQQEYQEREQERIEKETELRVKEESMLRLENEKFQSGEVSVDLD